MNGTSRRSLAAFLTLALCLALSGWAQAQTRPNRAGTPPGPGRSAPTPPPIDGLPPELVPGGDESGTARSSVVINKVSVEARKIWAGDQQKFQAWISVAGEPPRLESLELVVRHPRAGERVEKKDVLRLTPEQLRGNQPVDWVLPFSTPGLYEFFVRAQGLGSPQVERLPKNNAETFRVDLLWQVIAWAVGLTLLAFLIARFLLTGLFSRLVKNQTKVPPFSLIFWLVATTMIWWWFFGIWTIWVVVGAAVILLAAMIYVFT